MTPLGPFETAPALAVAVSGGPDSLALALLAKSWTDERGGTLVALTVDHGLRPESAAEARQVGRWLGARGIGHRILRWCGPKPGAGLQAEARAARYALMTGWCRARGVLHLLLGHQREDQAETVLMRLERGSGLDGLAAMPRLAERDGVRLLRPLLAVPRARLIALLEAAGQPFIEDPSNLNPAFARVRLRAALSVLESHGFGADLFAGLAHRLGVARQVAELERARLLARAVRLEPAGYAVLAPAPLEAASDAQVAELFGSVIMTIGGMAYPPAPEALDRLVRAWRARALGRGRTLGGCRIVPARARLLVCREATACRPSLPLLAGEVRWDGRFAATVKGPARVGYTLSLGPLGAAGIVALRRGGEGARIERVPAPARPSLPAIRALDGFLTVPHLDYQGYGSVGRAGGTQPLVRLKPLRCLAEAPFSGAPAPARVASAANSGVG